MPDLIARGPKPTDTWRRPLPAGEPVVLGSDPGAWHVSWDTFLSRHHAELTWKDDRLTVRRLSGAKNPVFRQGRPMERFELSVGESFVIGRTVFGIADPESAAPAGLPYRDPGQGDGTLSIRPDRMPVETRRVAPRELNQLAFRDAPHRLDVLSKLPDVIGSATNDADLFGRLVDMLLAGIGKADAAALVAVEAPATAEPQPPDAPPEIRVLHWDRRKTGQGQFEPSRRLVTEAIAGRAQTVLHVWTGGGDVADSAEYTFQGQFDWAFCTPVPGEGCRGWGLYVAGKFTGEAVSTVLAPWPTNELRDDLKFTELVADILGSLRQVQVMRERQTVFRRFFSPSVLAVLSGGDAPRALEPRETDVAVLFCDLRGFSQRVEADDAAGKLLDVLHRVSTALGVMTTNILDHRGTIADFLGDAAMGFWGWPLDQPGKVEYACRAALGIRAHFEEASRDPSHPLSGFRVGVGVASGRAVAGGIGPPEQSKVTVFGPVVNLASRLQDMTRPLRVPILIDEPTADAIRKHLSADVARVRRLVKVRPYGLDKPLTVTELVPPNGPRSVLSDEDLAIYEAALDAFLAGEWAKAYEWLHALPPQDRGKDFLTGFILTHNHTPPPGWDGVVPLTAKG